MKEDIYRIITNRIRYTVIQTISVMTQILATQFVVYRTIITVSVVPLTSLKMRNFQNTAPLLERKNDDEFRK